MAGRLKKNGAMPDLIISSHAIRAYSTAMIFAHVMKYPEGAIRIITKLYASNTGSYISAIQTLPDQYSNVFLFAHNPTISQAMELLGGLEHQEMPTTGVAQIAFDCTTWADCIAKSGKLMLLDYPKNGLD